MPIPVPEGGPGPRGTRSDPRDQSSGGGEAGRRVGGGRATAEEGQRRGRESDADPAPGLPIFIFSYLEFDFFYNIENKTRLLTAKSFFTKSFAIRSV